MIPPFILADAGPALWPTLEHLALILAILGAIVGIMVARRKREIRRIEPQPLEVEGEIKVLPKGRRFSQETCDEKHRALEAQIASTQAKLSKVHPEAWEAFGDAIGQRLHSHDEAISELWRTMRQEDKDTREALSQAVRDFDRTVGELHGTLTKLGETTQLILEKELER